MFTPSGKKPRLDIDVERKDWDLFAISEWTDDDDGLDYYDVLVLLPSSISKNTDYAIKVGDGGTSLLVDLKLPDAVTDLDIMKLVCKRNDVTMAEKHPVFSGFAQYLKSTGRSAVDDELWHYYKIDLEKKVEANNKFVNCMTLRSSSTVCHVRLQLVSDTFANSVRAKSMDIDEVDF